MKLINLLKHPGIGWNRALFIWSGYDICAKDITVSDKLFTLYYQILKDNLYHERTLINFLKYINHVKGRKFIFKLPVRGQRTHTNSRTVKKVIVG